MWQRGGLNRVGVPINMTYGTLPLYPFAILFSILRNKIIAYYLGIEFWLIVSNIISYIFSRKYYDNDFKAFLFTIMYTFSNYLFGNFFKIGDIGQAVAGIFMPMLVYGCYASLIKNDAKNGEEEEWFYIPLSLSAIIYSHIISTLIAISIIAIFLILAICLKKNILFKLKSLTKQLFFTLGITSFYWINLFSALKNKLFIPPCPKLGGMDVGLLIQQQFTWGENRVGALVALIFVIGLLNWNKLTIHAKITAGIALLYAFLITNISTVFLIILSHTPFRMIQWTGRLMSAVNLFSIIFDVDVVTSLLKKSHLQKIGYFGIMGLFLISFIGQGLMFMKNPNLKKINYYPSLQHKLPIGNWKIDSSKELNYITTKNYTGIGFTDYWPNRSINFKNSIISNNTKINKRYRKIKIKHNVDEFQLNSKLNKNTKVNAPILYNKQYKVFQNGKNIPYHESKRGTVAFKH